MAKPSAPAAIRVGDPMPRIALPQASGGLFDSWDPRSAGYARAYWVGAPPATVLAPPYADQLAAHEMLLHIVTTAAPAGSLPEGGSWLIDRCPASPRVCTSN